MSARLPWVWDYDLNEADFEDLLQGRKTLGRIDRDWAASRLLDYAPWSEIRRRMSLSTLVEDWPRWRSRVRSLTRRRGFDFLVAWLPENHGELL